MRAAASLRLAGVLVQVIRISASISSSGMGFVTS
jgi:hypothetical protein